VRRLLATTSAPRLPDVQQFDPAFPYRLNGQIGLRPEPFGALAYHFVTRRLVFLKSPELVALVERLGDYDSVDAALDEHIAVEKHPSYRTALASLHEADVITATSPSDTPLDDPGKAA